VFDVDDCLAAADYLAAEGLIDRRRVVIRGGSAGGYTTLATLAFRRGAVAAGASYYGVGDLEALARDTHKFESRYLDRLIGPYPEQADRYRARSPIHYADQLAAPAIFFQGLDDKVVPPNQAATMVSALRTMGLPVAYLTFEGEGHGFRSAQAIVRSLEAELIFYARVLGFAPAGALPAIEIENLY
jgi:dipeptidyl aminopeptidase/acylaminoacyl peptidase